MLEQNSSDTSGKLACSNRGEGGLKRGGKYLCTSFFSGKKRRLSGAAEAKYHFLCVPIYFLLFLYNIDKHHTHVLFDTPFLVFCISMHRIT